MDIILGIGIGIGIAGAWAFIMSVAYYAGVASERKRNQKGS